MIKCLYIDDEPGLLELTKEYLEREGDISVRTCDSPEKALDALKAAIPDVVISDYQMPGMDGIQLFNEVRKRWHDVPFVLFTGKGREEVVIKALNVGIDLYIKKGGNPRAQFAELANAIKQLARRREAEDAVCYNNRKFRNIIEGIMDVVLIIDGRGMIQYVSPSVHQNTRFRPEELLGTCIFDLLHIDDREPMINSSTCSSEAVTPLQCRVMTRDGDYKWFESISRPVPPELGRGQFILSSRDIDDRKRMELEIARREMLLKAVYDNSTDLMGIISPDGTIQMVNRRFCEISHYNEDELVSRQFLDFVSPDSQDTASRHLRMKMTGGTGRTSYKAMLRRRDGIDVWLSVTSQKIDAPGLETVVLVMGNELTGDDDIPAVTAGDISECGTITSPVISLQAHGPEDT